MAARKRFTYHPRKIRTGYVWEYSINEEAGLPTDWCDKRRSSGLEVSYSRGGKPTQRSEREIFQWCVKRVDKLRAEYKAQFRKLYDPTLGDILDPYFDFDRCPRIQRLLEALGDHYDRLYALTRRIRFSVTIQAIRSHTLFFGPDGRR